MKRSSDPNRVTKAVRVPMDTSMLAIPKPGPRLKGQPKDGRLIERGAAYSKTKHAMWERQGRRCWSCGKFLPTPAWAHRHHVNGRGLGGGRRDDRQTVLVCPDCHEAEHPGPQWSKPCE